MKFILKAEGAVINRTEQLMSEHGAMDRLLCVFSETAHRLKYGQEVSAAPIKQALELFGEMGEAHQHEEETEVFPKFDRSTPMGKLVQVLLKQHRGADKIVEASLALCNSVALKESKDREKLAMLLCDLERTVRWHMQKEESELFPEFQRRFPGQNHLSASEHLGKYLPKIEGIEKEMGFVYPKDQVGKAMTYVGPRTRSDIVVAAWDQFFREGGQLNQPHWLDHHRLQDLRHQFEFLAGLHAEQK